MRQGAQRPSKPPRAEVWWLPASRSISGGGSGNRIAAVDARWQIGEGGHRGLVAGGETAKEGTCLAECRPLGNQANAIHLHDARAISRALPDPPQGKSVFDRFRFDE